MPPRRGALHADRACATQRRARRRRRDGRRGRHRRRAGTGRHSQWRTLCDSQVGALPEGDRARRAACGSRAADAGSESVAAANRGGEGHGADPDGTGEHGRDRDERGQSCRPGPAACGMGPRSGGPGAALPIAAADGSMPGRRRGVLQRRPTTDAVKASAHEGVGLCMATGCPRTQDGKSGPRRAFRDGATILERAHRSIRPMSLYAGGIALPTPEITG